ncbi:MAG: glycosyltransferase [Paracoccaceae bacterium]|nr:glycosyltransferase [Paracoccaceae bacterium]
MTRIALVCCHLTGTGHLVRTLTLGRALTAAGAQVLVISGGRPLDHISTQGLDVVQLPPVEVRNLDYTRLYVPGAGAANEEYLADRLAQLDAVLMRFRPNALVTELYPLGRRILAAEFQQAIAASKAANSDVAVIASVRDIPEPPKRPGRLEEAVERLRTDYDALLVHGDAGFLPLYAAWPLPGDLASMTHHTGYVTEAPPPAGPPGDTVLVAVGGGALGRRLLEIAAKAATRCRRPWHLLTGGTDAAETAADLATRHPSANLTIEPARSDYPALLARAACSVSLAGYNTTLDLLACDTPAVVVPFDEKGEREQVIRAGRLAGLDGFTVLNVEGLDATRLGNAVDSAASGPRRKLAAVDREGAQRAARKILELAG